MHGTGRDADDRQGNGAGAGYICIGPFSLPTASGSLPMARVTRQKPVFSRPEQRAIVLEALKILPNVWQVYRSLGKRIGISYGTIWNVAKAEGIELIRLDRRRLNPRARRRKN
jgi:hypothetical protein